MTERALQGIGARASTGTAEDAAATRPVARRRDSSVPPLARAGMLLGASTALYAVALAGVSGLQHADDAAIIARRAPLVATVDAARVANDRLEAALLEADAGARALGADYAATAGALGAFEARLDELAVLVAEVQGSAAALPARVSLPSVSVRAAAKPAPRTTATTGASGG